MARKDDFEILGEQITSMVSNRLQKLLDRILLQSQNEIADLINEYMVDAYYQGYSPTMYQRTFQLHNAVGPYVKWFPELNGSAITVGYNLEPPNYGGSKMDHRYYSVKVSWLTKRGIKEKIYTYKVKDYSQSYEDNIINNYFLKGLHPRFNRKPVRGKTPVIEKQIEKILMDYMKVNLPVMIKRELKNI